MTSPSDEDMAALYRLKNSIKIVPAAWHAEHRPVPTACSALRS